MCGIAGVFEQAGASADSVARVDAMLTDIRHRGPDARGTRPLDGTAGTRATLGAVRLRVIDLAPTADQPMSDAVGRVWTVFNGEIYNFKELRAELVAAGYVFRSQSDTECLVHLWHHVEGDVARMASRLRGMFAFAIWDTQTSTGALVRDRLGIKPLFWTPTPTGLAFASEQRALARAGFVDASPNEDVLAGYLTKGVVPIGATILRDVRSLEPGSALTWNGGTPTVAHWWRPIFSLRADLLDTDRAAGEVAASVGDAVARHLVADRKVGVFLSSGTDSTAVAAIAAQHGAQHSLTVGFPDEPEFDEGTVAAGTARRLGFDHTEVPTTATDAAEYLPSFLASLDSPTADAFNSWLVCRAAHESGLVVALSGLGGDELFAGYRTFNLVPRLRRVTPVLSRLPTGVRHSLAAALRTRARTRPFERAFGAGPGIEGAYHAMRSLFGPDELAAIGLAAPVLTRVSPTLDPLDAVSLLELKSYLRYQLLPDADTTSMAHSLEVRVPLLDDRVVDTALALPPRVRADGKRLLAAAAGIVEPPKKRTFTLPLERWLQGALRPTMQTALLDDSLPFADALPHAFRAQLWSRFETGRTHWSRVWAVGVLRLWPAANGLSW
ncbi:MAG TPA: asparagine synthase (glutamine-hydrolyzing) [Acidimicrobiales bacterium]|nr:asparagine synthase (glutamine-hydrolyzing) [Acidimicrobiales bacterium]